MNLKIKLQAIASLMIIASTSIASEPNSMTSETLIQKLSSGIPQTAIIEVKINENELQGIHSSSAESINKRTTVFNNAKQQALNLLGMAEAGTQSTSGIKVLEDYSHLPLLSVNVQDLNALNTLASNPYISKIHANEAHKTSLNQSLPLIRQPDAAAGGFIGAGSTVAVLDTGTDYTHSAFGYCTAPNQPSSCKIVHSQDFAANDNQLDDDGHGTNVAGIVLGVAPGAKVASLDVFESDGLAYSDKIISAINWAISNKTAYNIVALNMSLGGGSYSAPCANSWSSTAFTQARAAGILPIVASGNDAYTTSISSPACEPSAISVGAVYDSSMGGVQWSGCSDSTTYADKVTCFANSANFLKILAPGAIITAAGLNMGGTSQATPHVAGAVAVLKSAKPSATPDEIQQLLESSGTPVTDGRNAITKPRLDLNGALQAINANPIDQPDFFVKQQYLDFLGREANQSEANYWVGLLNTNARTRSEVIYGFFGSPEFQAGTAPLARLYFSFFNRIPDFGGLEHHRHLYSTGTPLVTIAQAFAESAEFRNTYGNLTNEQYVNQLYLNVLGRAPDADGLRGWVDHLKRGATRGEVMLGFSESPEYINRSFAWVQVSMMYHGMLRRSAEQGGFDFWVKKLANGVSIFTLIDGFMNSQEYRYRF